MPLGRFRVGMIEPVERADWSTWVRAIAEVELRLATGDPHQADELDLLVLLDARRRNLNSQLGRPLT